jgi:hypothetical protein
MGFILVGIYAGKWAQIDFVLYLLSVFACKSRILEGALFEAEIVQSNS